MVILTLVACILQFLGTPCYSLEKDNENGIDAFFNAQYKEGLEEFNKVLEAYCQGKTSEVDCGLALWGRMLCHAALEHLAEFHEDVLAVEWFFIDYHGCACTQSIAKKNSRALDAAPIIPCATKQATWFDRPIGQKAPEMTPQFADPYAKITKQECIDRVKGTAKALRGAIAVLKRREVVWTLNTLIDNIQAAGVSCCESGAFWATCVSPIVMRLKQWKMFGVPDDPSWD
jgi:hypothetical protein